MAQYIDGFVFAVPKKNLVAYKKMAKDASIVWRKFGALDYKECVGDDLNPKTEGSWKMISFPKMLKVKSTETIWFSYIVFKSKAHRTMVNKKVMAYFNEKYKDSKEMPMPFDPKRMAYGGFSVAVG